MPLARKAHPYYNFDKLMSYATLAYYFFLVGGRGLGKTFGAKKRAIAKALKTGEQFIYLRRYKTEIVASKETFFADIGHLFPDWDFAIHGYTAVAAPASTRDEKKREWKTIGYFVALSTAQSKKGVSYHNVTTIIFDEFIIEKGTYHYLPNEVTVFNNFYLTVDRYQDKTKAFFLANSVSIQNPYFLEYEIRPDENPNSEFVKKANGYLVAHFPDAANFQSSVFETAFGRFIAGTEYADYAVSNEFSDNNDSLIGLKDSRARCQYVLETKNGKFSVWYDSFTAQYFIQAKLPKDVRVFTIVPDKMSTDKVFLTFNDPPMQQLRAAFRTARTLFDKPSTRNTFVEIFKR